MENLKKFNACADNLYELKEVWDCSGKLDEIDKVEPGFQAFYRSLYDDAGEAYKEAYQKAREDIKSMIIKTLGDFKVLTKQMKNSFDMYIVLMQARVEYIESNNTQDSLYGNYKLRTEWNNLKRNIKKQENLRNVGLAIAEKMNLTTFGLEIEGEPGIE